MTQPTPPRSLDNYHVNLHAIDDNRGIARDYRITATPDLFGWIIVERSWGKIGGRSQSKRSAFICEADARRLVRSILARRATARHRIGVAYQIV